MPYRAETKKQSQAAAAKKYAQAHPDRVAAQKSDWYNRNRALSIARSAEWRRNNPEAVFNGHLKRKYGLTRGQYDQMGTDQKWMCAICSGPPVGKTKRGSAARFDVDHDHQTGKVRGLLCHPCNVMLGQARDRKEILGAAILYLETRS